MPSPNNVLTADSYIQDGLVFQLDGIEYGGIDGQWIDRKGGIAATFNSLVTRLGESFRFANGAKALFPRNPAFDGNNYSMEFIGTINSSYANIFAPFKNGGLRLYSYVLNPGYVGFNSGRSAMIAIINNDINVLHARIGYFVNKGRFVNTTREFVPVAMTSECGINPSYNTNYSYQGRIYAIRCYSRQLSDREILINQKIDNARFGLGLNIPDEVLPASRSLSLLEPFTLPDDYESEQETTNETSDER